MSNLGLSQENDERNENMDIEAQCPSNCKVDEDRKTTFEQWKDEILVFLRAIAVSLDLLFLYVPVIKEDRKCIGSNKVLLIIAIVLRSVIDINYIVHFVWEASLLIRRDERNNESNTICWATVRRHIWFMFNVLFILPIPQVVMPIIFSEMRRTKSSNITILNFVILLHYGARVSQIYRYILAGHKSAEKCDEASLWIKVLFYLFLYILAGHVMGAFWYFFSTQRLTDCWHKACEIHGDGVEISFNCDHSFRKLSFLDDFCPIDTSNPSTFDFGIFLEARRSGILESTGFLQKVLYSCWWGLRNLSSYGSNLQTSSYIWENIFALGISILGLVSFLYFMGNMQVYMQRRTSESIERCKPKKK